MESKNLTNNFLNAINKESNNDEQIKERARKLFTAYEKMKENDFIVIEDFVEVMFRELFEPKKTINKESKIKNENT